jgi:hypothetical protein
MQKQFVQRQFSIIALGAIAICAHCRTTFAQSDVVVPEGCGSADAFRSGIQERLGSESESLLAQTRLRITAEANDFQLWVQVVDRSRTLRDGNCEDLFRAAVVVALALWNAPVEVAPDRPTLAAEPVTNAHQENPAAPLKPSPRIPTTATAQPVPTRDDWRWRGALGGQFGAIQGILPHWAIASGAFGSAEFGPVG